MSICVLFECLCVCVCVCLCVCISEYEIVFIFQFLNSCETQQIYLKRVDNSFSSSHVSLWSPTFHLSSFHSLLSLSMYLPLSLPLSPHVQTSLSPPLTPSSSLSLPLSPHVQTSLPPLINCLNSTNGKELETKFQPFTQ